MLLFLSRKKIIWEPSSFAKFNPTKKIVLRSSAKLNPREISKFRGLLEPRNLIPVKFNPLKVLDYFETNYVGELRRGRRNPPLFAHEMWNMNGRVAGNLPRTNNYVEGWHNRFRGMVNHVHPNIWKFLEMVRREATHNEMVMAQILGGANPPPQKRADRDVTIRIQNLIQNCQLANVLQFLRGISYNLTDQKNIC